jgi:hypothetical protein
LGQGYVTPHLHLGGALLCDALLAALLLHRRLTVEDLVHRLLRRPLLHRQHLRGSDLLVELGKVQRQFGRIRSNARSRVVKSARLFVLLAVAQRGFTAPCTRGFLTES